MNYTKLFNYMSEEHGITLLESGMNENVQLIVRASGGLYAKCISCNSFLT